MIKILIFTNELSEKNGWGRYALELSRQLIQKGYQPVVICQKENNSIQWVKQIAILPNPLNYKKCYFFSWFFVLKLFFNYKILSKTEIIHCAVETYLPITVLFSLLKKIPVFVTVHGSFGVKTSYQIFYHWIQYFCYQHSQRIICVSRYTETRLLAVYPNIKTVVIPNGVNLSNFELGQPREIVSVNDLSILSVGSLKKRKGFHLVLLALPDILKVVPSLKYYIVGSLEDKEYLQSLKKIIKNLNLSRSVIFYSGISDLELQKLYHQSTVFVLTPISDQYNFEGFGLVYLEANACGLPVVGSKDNGGEEAIVDGKTGFLAESNNSSSISNLVLKLLSNPKQYAIMSRESIAWAEDHDWSVIVSRYIEIYQQMA